MGSQLNLDRDLTSLLDAFEELSPEDRRADIARANAYLASPEGQREFGQLIKQPRGTITRACPTLAAPEPREAAAWYRDALGFTVKLALDGYAIVARDDAELHFWQCSDRHIAENTSAYLRTETPDALHAAFGAVVGGRISPVMDREWGMREFYVHDPYGNLLKFGCPVTTASADRSEPA